MPDIIPNGPVIVCIKNDDFEKKLYSVEKKLGRARRNVFGLAAVAAFLFFELKLQADKLKEFETKLNNETAG